MLAVTREGKCSAQQSRLQGGRAEAHSVDLHACPARLRCAQEQSAVIGRWCRGSPAHFPGTADAEDRSC